MSSTAGKYSNGERRSSGTLDLGIAVAGVAWIAVVVWFLAYALDRAAAVALEGVIAEPSTSQIVIAYVLAVIFALPGVGLIGYALARRRSSGGRSDGAAR